MTQSLKILNSKETKHIYELLQEQFGYVGKLDVVFLLSEKKERIYIFTRDFADFDLGTIKVDSMGLYFATMYEGKLRLTIDATQMIGKDCKKNVVNVTKKEMQTWLSGDKLIISELANVPEDIDGFIILRYGDQYLGCGKVGGDTILNYIPKTRYIHALYEDVN